MPKEVAGFIAKGGLVTNKQLSEKFGFSKITSANYLSRARKLGLAIQVAPNVIISAKQAFPGLTPTKKRILKAIRAQMPFLDVSIWSTFDLNKFAHNIIMRETIFIETVPWAAETLAETLNASGIKSAVLGRKRDINYLSSLMDVPVIVIKRKDTAGTFIDKADAHAHMPTYEKILVDLYFLITRRNFSLPISELGNIITNISMFNYSLNFSLLNWIALRRHVSDEMSRALHELKKKNRDLLIPEKYARNARLNVKKMSYIQELVG